MNERANSTQGSVHSKSRNRLRASRVNKLMKISFNRRLESTAKAKGTERAALGRTFARPTADMVAVDDDENENADDIEGDDDDENADKSESEVDSE